MPKCFLSLFFLLISFSGLANKYYVFFTDKQGQTLNPHTYFHENTIIRRNKCDVPLVQKTDLPVKAEYVNALRPYCDSITTVSRWFNMACVYANSSNLTAINSLPFVKYIQHVNDLRVEISALAYDSKAKLANHLEYQTERMEGSLFAKAGIEGDGVRIAVLDAGFTGANTHKSLSHLKIVNTYDFVAKRESPYRGSTHGTSVLSVIGGIYNEKPMGLAPKAQFLLARTERHFFEQAAEEEYWLAAAEWADKNGADIINSSLGYTNNRYFLEDMDGSSLVSKAANMAFAKGIIVVTSAGNDGDNSWRYIGAPADADSVLAIGALNPKTDVKTGFSSYGPNAKGNLKPNLCASGITFCCNSGNNYEQFQGTSFSSPLVAGFVACYLQKFPNKNQKQVFEELQKAGHLYPYFDYAHGYGVPLASKALGGHKTNFPDFEIVSDSSSNSHLLVPLNPSISVDSFARLCLAKNMFVKLESYTHKVVYYNVGTLRKQSISDSVQVNWPKVIIYTNIGNAVTVGKKYYLTVHFEGYTKQKLIIWK
ncbi:MAG: S8 family serine peptidase [Bacteroidia bacterium]